MFPMQNSVNDRDYLCQQYLNTVYRDKKGHRSQPAAERIISESYGEILYPSVNKLLSILNLQEDDVFWDAGSGLGKLAMQVFLSSKVKAVYGIEIIPELHQKACEAAQQLQRELPEFYSNNRALEFLLGSFLEVPLENATVLFIGSPCFTPLMLDTLSYRIQNTPSIHTVLTLRPLCRLQRLTCTSYCRIQGSWDTALCYIYRSSR